MVTPCPFSTELDGHFHATRVAHRVSGHVRKNAACAIPRRIDLPCHYPASLRWQRQFNHGSAPGPIGRFTAVDLPFPAARRPARQLHLPGWRWIDSATRNMAHAPHTGPRPPYNQPVSESFYLDYAQELVDQSDLAGAEAALRVLFRIPGFRPDAALALAEILFRLGRPTESVQLLQAHADNPACADRLREYHLGEFDFAAVKALLAKRPKSLKASGWLDKAVLRQLDGDVSGAIDACHAALALEPEDAYALNALGRAQFRAGHKELARDLFGRVTGLRPLFAEGWHNLAHVLVATGNAQGAVHAYQKALECAPAHRSSRRNLAVSLMMCRRDAEALPILQKLLEEHADDEDALVNFGVCLQLLGRVDEAERHLREQHERFPENFIVQAQLGRLYCQQHRFEEACNLLGKALKLRPHEADLRLELATVLLQVGRSAEAEVLVRAGLVTDPRNADLLGLLEQIRKTRDVRRS